MSAPPDDQHLAVRRWRGESPPVVLVHATGFCKETWEPVVARAQARGLARELLAMDQRGHGDSFVPGPPFDWWDLGRDILSAAGPGPFPLGVGHSSGAAALVLAELTAPGSFESLLLIEPIIFPPPYGRMEQSSLTESALRRKNTFASPAEALANFRGRGPFEHWTDGALESYVHGGLRRDGSTLALKCRPEVEAEFYRAATEHGAWGRLGELAVPVTLVGGAGSTSHPRDFLDMQAAKFADARVVIVDGATHFVPMEQPDQIAILMVELLA